MFNETKNQTGESQQQQNSMPSQDSENLEGQMEKLNNSEKKSSKKVGIIILLIFLGGAVVGSYYFWNDITNFLNLKEEVKEVDCATDTEECPNGSFVKRISPSCEFAECPIIAEMEIDDATKNQTDTSNWQTYRNEKFGFEMKYPTDWKKASEEDKEKSSTSLSVFGMPVLDRDFLGKEDSILVLVDIAVLDNLEKKSLNDFSLEKKGGEDVILIPRNGFSVNGIEIIQAGYNYKELDMLEVLNMIKISPKEFVYIQLIAGSDFKDDIDIFNQIISTFELFQDTDNDGLSDDDEARYGCDINNPDSDGDGYLDGDEVENGYDPMGEGKL